MSDEEKRAPGNVRRVSSRNRKDQLDYGSNLFPPESPLTPDSHADAYEPGEPLPFDESAFLAQTVDRYPPLPFDGDDPAPLSAQEAERFPALPTPVWAHHEAAAAEDDVYEDEPLSPPRLTSPALARGKARKTAPKKPASRGRGCLYNLLTLLFFALTIGAVAYGIYIFQNPYSPLNPLPPATSLPIMITTTPGPQEPVAPVLDATPTPENALATEAPVVNDEPATAT